MGGRTVLNRNFDDFQITAVRLHFGLEKWTTRSDPAAENNLQRFAGEQLKSAGHVGQLGTEQQIGHESSAETDPVARERSVDKGPARTKPAAEDAVVTLAHVFEERRNVGRLVTESGVDFQNPIRICLERLAISANIRVDDIAIFRRPNDRQLRHLRRMGLEDFPSVVPARLVDDREEFPAAHGRAIHQDGVYETDRRLGFIRHRTSDCERNVFEVAHGRNLGGGGYPTTRKKRADSFPSARSKLTASIIRPRPAIPRRPGALSCSERGAASTARCSATAESAPGSRQTSCPLLRASSVFHRRARSARK